MSRLVPYPLLALGLLAMWVLLNGASPGQIVLGILVALFATRAMAALGPSRPRLRRWSRIPGLFGIVTYDILVSNIAVVRNILEEGRRPRVPGFVAIPLELRDPIGLTVLAIIITSTPGTAWIEYDSDSDMLLIHVLDLGGREAEWVALIKNRYEAPLMEIFE